MYYIIIIAQRVNSISPALMKYSLYFFTPRKNGSPLSIGSAVPFYALNVVRSRRKNALWENREAAM